MTTTSIQDLEIKIELLVREHMAACRAAASAAVERAFNSTGAARSKTQRRGARRASSRPRRSPEEVAELAERLYAAVCARPGEAMRVLAGAIGATPRELNRPMTLLKRRGQVRSAGQRHQTRYFPMSE